MKQSPRTVIGLLAVAVLTAAVAAADWNAAVAAYRAHRWQDAARELGAVLERHPDYAPGHYLLGLVRLQLGDHEGGVTELRRAAELDPARPQYAVGLVQALVTAGQAEEALKVAEGIGLDGLTKDQRTLLALLEARAALRVKEPARAVPAVRGALEAMPDSAPLYHALGSLLEASGDLGGAFDADVRSFELDPRPDSRAGMRALDLAHALAARAGDAGARQAVYRRAMAVARKLVEGSEDPAVLHAAGRVALGAGEAETATGWLGAAGKKRPADPQLAYDLGRAEAAAGDEEAAYTTLARALTLSPDKNLARRVHLRMARLDTHRLRLDAAIEHFRAAGEADRAEKLRTTAKGLEEAEAQRRRLAARIHKLESARERLQELGDTDGVTATTRELDTLKKDLAETEKNLEEVRAGLERL